MTRQTKYRFCWTLFLLAISFQVALAQDSAIPSNKPPARQIKVLVPQMFLRTINLGGEQRIGQRTALEFGVGYIHPKLIPSVLNFVEQNKMNNNTNGLSARIAYKYYPVFNLLPDMPYVAIEFRYRYHTDPGSTRIDFPGGQPLRDYSHDRNEFILQARVGKIQNLNEQFFVEYFVALGANVQQRKTTYGTCHTCFGFTPFEEQAGYFDNDNGWFAEPQIQLGVALILER